MAEIVKNLGDAEKRGLIGGSGNSGGSDLGKIIADVKSIIDGVKDLRGFQKPKDEGSGLTQMNNKNVAPRGNNQIQESTKTPLAVLKINDEELNKFLDADVKKIFDNDNINPETTLKDIVDKWDILKELLRPELKKAVGKIARADLEFK